MILPRAAGIAVPLFALRGAHDVGSGDILDLIGFIDWLASWHQGVVQLLPINESAPGEASPYNALSVFAIDPTYIRASTVPDVMECLAAQQWLRAPALQRRIERLHGAAKRQRPAAYGLQLRLLEFGFAQFTASGSRARLAAFDRFCAHNAWWLEDYALFRALSERRRFSSWETWPEPLRRREPQALETARAALHQRIRFAEYLQWIAAEQWQQIRMHARQRGVLLKGDLPFVCGRSSADVWAHQELFDLTSSAGAPPDAFSASGQAWGLPLYNWTAARQTNYAWWRARARQAGTLYDMFRVDHVVGLYRTYAIPVEEGGTAGFVPSSDDEQREQGNALMQAIIEESGDAFLVAEDLGTVPNWVRASLSGLGIAGYKVFRWERSDGTYIDPRTYPVLSVATSGTHDTETLAEWWEQLDPNERSAVQKSLGLNNSALNIQNSTLPFDLLDRLYAAGSALTILPIQDVLGWRERINTPATIDPANWSYRLPVASENLDEQAGVGERMQMIRKLTDTNGRWPVRSNAEHSP